jgi:hypothetical protein
MPNPTAGMRFLTRAVSRPSRDVGTKVTGWTVGSFNSRGSNHGNSVTFLESTAKHPIHNSKKSVRALATVCGVP